MGPKAIYVTKSDLEELQALLMKERAARGSGEHLAKLQGELEKAEIVAPEDVPADVVTMHSTVELVDLDTGKPEVYTLVFPDEADIEHGRVSVLAPIGTAMLGYRAGDEFEWKVPAGLRRLRVNTVLSQPEREGRLEA